MELWWPNEIINLSQYDEMVEEMIKLMDDHLCGVLAYPRIVTMKKRLISDIHIK